MEMKTQTSDDFNLYLSKVESDVLGGNLYSVQLVSRDKPVPNTRHLIKVFTGFVGQEAYTLNHTANELCKRATGRKATLSESELIKELNELFQK